MPDQQERVSYLERQLADADEECLDLGITLRGVREERDRLTQQINPLATRAAQLEAELAATQHRLRRLLDKNKELRASIGFIVARDGGRMCEGCDQEIRRGQAYTADSEADVLVHVHCPDGAS